VLRYLFILHVCEVVIFLRVFPPIVLRLWLSSMQLPLLYLLVQAAVVLPKVNDISSTSSLVQSRRQPREENVKRTVLPATSVPHLRPPPLQKKRSNLLLEKRTAPVAVVASSIFPYNETLALEYVFLASATYSSPESLENWTCGFGCDKLRNVVVPPVLVTTTSQWTTSLQGFVAHYRDGCIFSFQVFTIGFSFHSFIERLSPLSGWLHLLLSICSCQVFILSPHLWGGEGGVVSMISSK